MQDGLQVIYQLYVVKEDHNIYFYRNMLEFFNLFVKYLIQRQLYVSMFKLIQKHHETKLIVGISI